MNGYVTLGYLLPKVIVVAATLLLKIMRRGVNMNPDEQTRTFSNKYCEGCLCGAHCFGKPKEKVFCTCNCGEKQREASEIDRIRVLESQLSSLRQSAKDVLCNVHQLIEGWHTDVAWTEYDQSVLKSVEELQHRIEK